MSAKPLRMALGSLLIQKEYQYLDRELMKQIRGNPYYQYFIRLPEYEDNIPFVPSLLAEFRKRLSEDVLNEMIIAYNSKDDKEKMTATIMTKGVQIMAPPIIQVKLNQKRKPKMKTH